MAETKKTKVTCFNCNSRYRLNLDKVPPGKTSFKCFKCGEQVQILDLVLPKAEEAAPKTTEEQKTAAQAPAAAPPPMPEEAWEEDRDDEDEGGDSWLAIYGDMMSILMIFFVLLFAISSVDKGKFQVVMESVSKALGGSYSYQPKPEPGASKTKVPMEKPVAKVMQGAKAESAAMAQLKEELGKAIQQAAMEGKFAVKDEPKGMVLIGRDQAMFDSGSASIKPEIKPFLTKLGDILKKSGHDITVEGHTDNLPIKNERFPSNWELSVMRATNVVHFLLSSCGLPPGRVSAAGYSYYRPRYPFDSENAAKNRRIEILVKRRYDPEVIKDISGAAKALK